MNDADGRSHMSEDQSTRQETGTRALLDALAQGDQDETITLRDLLAGLNRRAFGMLLFASVLPAFIPIPIGGAISGPLVMLIGAQLAIGVRRPWLPNFLASRGPHRHALARFDRMISPWLARLEHLIRPRLAVVLDHRLAGVVTGVLLAVARISGETAPLLFTALSNQFWTSNLAEPMASLPVTIFKFAMSPYENWQGLAWAGVFIITLAVLALNILARALNRHRI
jgi:hypothetical protein